MYKVVITGAGLVSAAGHTPEEVFTALDTQRACTQPAPEKADAMQGPITAIPDFDPVDWLGEQNFRPLDRVGRLSVVAALNALDASGWTAEMREQHDVGLVFGTLFSGLETVTTFDRNILEAGPKYARPMDFANTVLNAAAGQTALWHNLRGINSTVAGGSASGLQAVIQAVDFIAGGQAKALLAGGAEELCDPAIEAWRRLGLSRPDQDSDGFCPGEGAAFLMLEEEAFAKARGATILAEITAVASGFDPTGKLFPQTTLPVAAHTLETVLKTAQNGLEIPDCVSISANGCKLADDLEAVALEQVCGFLPPTIAVKTATGEAPGASGALQLIMLLEAMRHSRLPGHNKTTDIQKGVVCGLAMDGPVAAISVVNRSNKVGLHS